MAIESNYLNNSTQTYHAQMYDIVIVGAGLVGATLAALVASSNPQLSIALIDQSAAPVAPNLEQQPPHFDHRVVALTQASIQLFQHIGVWNTVVNQRACGYQHMTVWDDEGTGSIHFSANELAQPALGYIVENSLLLSAILNCLETAANITCLRHCSLEKITENNQTTGRYIFLSNQAVLNTSLIIGADGANSRVRKLLAMPIRQWDYKQKAIVTTVKTQHSHRHTAWQNFLATGPLAFLPLDHQSEHYCSIVWSLDTEAADVKMALSDQDFSEVLTTAIEGRLGNIVWVDKRSCFPLTQRHAQDYYKPQVALVGDAAHTIHPLAGQGVNLGLLDAQALTQEITRACARQLPLYDESILRRYQRQRKRHNLALMATMEGFKRLFGEPSLSVRWLRNQGLTIVDNAQFVKKWLAKQAMGL